MDENVSEMMDVAKAERNSEETDFYKQMIESMSHHFEKLIELYDQMMIIRLKSARTKLTYLKCRRDLQSTDVALASFDKALDV